MIDSECFSITAATSEEAQAMAKPLIEQGQARVEHELEDGAVLVVRHLGTGQRPGLSGQGLGPVYRLSSLEPAVPTGRVFVRFDDKLDSRSQEPALNRLGFQIESVPSYAPHACWVTHKSGTAAALREFSALRGLPQVHAVEPQFLIPSSGRGRL